MTQKFLLSTICAMGFLAACQSSEPVTSCPHGFVETTNLGMGEPVICCPLGTTGQDGFCVDTPADFEANATTQTIQANTVVAEGVTPTPQTTAEPDPLPTPVIKTRKVAESAANASDFVYLTAPNGKGSAYCPKQANSVAWNASEFKCCGNGLTAVSVPSRDDSICCPVGTLSARWVGLQWNDFECCPAGTAETANTGSGDKYICCPAENIGKDGKCISVKKI